MGNSFLFLEFSTLSSARHFHSSSPAVFLRPELDRPLSGRRGAGRATAGVSGTAPRGTLSWEGGAIGSAVSRLRAKILLRFASTAAES